MLQEPEEDALKELFNIGIGRAAGSLSEMVDDEVLLSVPHLSLLTRSGAAQRIQAMAESQIAAIIQDFGGPFSGTALLIYPEASSLALVRTLLRDETPLESLTELEQESLVEVGNIILNACLGTFANLMHLEFCFDLPQYFKGECSRLLQIKSPVGHAHPEDDSVFFLIVDFRTGQATAKEHRIKGFVILLLDMLAIQSLQQEIRTHFGI